MKRCYIACLQALTPAMEGWRKRIGRIAANFEAANKGQASAPQQPQQAQQSSSTTQAPRQVRATQMLTEDPLHSCPASAHAKTKAA